MCPTLGSIKLAQSFLLLFSKAPQVPYHGLDSFLEVGSLLRGHPVNVWNCPLRIKAFMRVRYAVLAVSLDEHIAEKACGFARTDGSGWRIVRVLLIVQDQLNFAMDMASLGRASWQKRLWGYAVLNLNGGK